MHPNRPPRPKARSPFQRALSQRKPLFTRLPPHGRRRNRNLVHPRDLARRIALPMVSVTIARLHPAPLWLLAFRFLQDSFLAVELGGVTDADPGSRERFAGFHEVI